MYKIFSVATIVASSLLTGCGQNCPNRRVEGEAIQNVSPNKLVDSVQFVEVGSLQKTVLAPPKTTYSYKLGIMIEKTRTYETVKYPDGDKVVPIINGFVPSVADSTRPNGDHHIVYDYRKHVIYKKK